jgi:hypothetical protein
VSGGSAPGVVSETTGAGQVYVALSRYLQSDEQQGGAPASAIAEILTSAYEDGQIRLLLRCAYAGKGRVVLTALDENGDRVKLGAASFYCTREDDALTVTVRVSGRGRRLLEASSRVRIRARVIDQALEQQPAGSRQSFELSP